MIGCCEGGNNNRKREKLTMLDSQQLLLPSMQLDAAGIVDGTQCLQLWGSHFCRLSLTFHCVPNEFGARRFLPSGRRSPAESRTSQQC